MVTRWITVPIGTQMLGIKTTFLYQNPTIEIQLWLELTFSNSTHLKGLGYSSLSVWRNLKYSINFWSRSCLQKRCSITLDGILRSPNWCQMSIAIKAWVFMLFNCKIALSPTHARIFHWFSHQTTCFLSFMEKQNFISMMVIGLKASFAVVSCMGLYATLTKKGGWKALPTTRMGCQMALLGVLSEEGES